VTSKRASKKGKLLFQLGHAILIGLGHDIKMVSHFMLSNLIFVSGDGAKEKGGGIWNLSKHGCAFWVLQAQSTKCNRSKYWTQVVVYNTKEVQNIAWCMQIANLWL
jgi:hypothetical protein